MRSRRQIVEWQPTDRRTPAHFIVSSHDNVLNKLKPKIPKNGVSAPVPVETLQAYGNAMVTKGLLVSCERKVPEGVPNPTSYKALPLVLERHTFAAINIMTQQQKDVVRPSRLMGESYVRLLRAWSLRGATCKRLPPSC